MVADRSHESAGKVIDVFYVRTEVEMAKKRKRRLKRAKEKNKEVSEDPIEQDLLTSC